VLLSNVRRSTTATNVKQMLRSFAFGQQGGSLQGHDQQPVDVNAASSAPALSPAQVLKQTPRSSIRLLSGSDGDVQVTAESHCAVQEVAPALPQGHAPVADDTDPAAAAVWQAAEAEECERDMRALRADLERGHQPPCLAAAVCDTAAAGPCSIHTEVSNGVHPDALATM
jgi:hypothetical protein